MAKKKNGNLVNAGRSIIEEIALEVQEKAEGIMEDQFPKLAFTLGEQTEKTMDGLRTPFHFSRGAIARLILGEVIDKPELFRISEFYEDTWRKALLSEPPKRPVQLLLPRKFNVYLRKTSQDILGTENRSEMFRIIVALYADVKGLLRRKRIEAIVLEFDDHSIDKPNG